MGYLERLDTYMDEMKEVLGEMVSYKSLVTEEVTTADGEVLPFGQEVHDSLMHSLNKGSELGFNVYNDDNYAGYIEYAASETKPADDYFGIVGHLDVVPVDAGWDSEPFEMVEKDGYLFGRGTADDKGPVVACLYALKAFKEEGMVPKMPVRVVLGLDEESGERSMAHFTEHVGHPVMGFTPDAEFPLVNGELGILVFDLAQKFSSKPGKDELRLTKLEAGTAHNAVPGNARAVIAGDKSDFDEISEKVKAYSERTGYNVTAKKQGSSLVVEAAGTAAHGAHPELGLNAISIMFDFLGEVGFANEELNDFIAFYNEKIGFNLHGENIGCGFEDEPSGKLIFNVGVSNINEEIASVTINIRYPVTFTDEQVLGGIQEKLEGTSLGIVLKQHLTPIYKPLDDPMVEKLMWAYRDETGDANAMPMVIGGGTYAKMVNNILAYGALFPGEEDTMHQANERFSLESFRKMTRIYAKAIYALCFE